ncbi:hypothetical protein HQ585_08885 [candidate division KSB1 bacterium]|nr:hypothetical protein [candidate division KSB1 bacterium]
MAFKREDTRKGITLPGMIDIIFLLLIFSLVTLSVSQATVETKKRGEEGSDFKLPVTTSHHTEKLESNIRTLVYQIEHTDPEDDRSPKRVLVLSPAGSDSVTIPEARARALTDSIFADFPRDVLSISDGQFERTQACRLIRSTLDSYKRQAFREPDLSNTIQIRAAEDTEFRIVNYILTRCSAYGDTIPNIALHTLVGKGSESGI